MALEAPGPFIAVAEEPRLRERRDTVLMQMIVRVDQGRQHQMLSQLLGEFPGSSRLRSQAQIAYDDAAIRRTGHGNVAQNYHPR